MYNAQRGQTRERLKKMITCDLKKKTKDLPKNRNTWRTFLRNSLTHAKMETKCWKDKNDDHIDIIKKKRICIDMVMIR